MLVQIIASRVNLAEDIEYFRKIRKIVTDLGHSVPYDWFDEEYVRMQAGDVTTKSIREVNAKTLEIISRADIIIAEGTSRSFSTGFLVANAIQLKKPVLVLTRGDILDGTFGSIMSSEFVRLVNYKDEGDLKSDIENFISDNTFENKDMRFNFFIDRKIYNYLRWASYKTGKTKAAILRDLVEREIDNKSLL